MSQRNHSLIEALEDRKLLSAAPWSQQAKLIGLDKVAQQYPSLTGAGQTIAIIDSGVDYNHPTLGGGWGKKVIAGYDYQGKDTNPMSDNYAHGTGSASMAASSGFDYKGQHYQGIAPGAKIVALRQNNQGGVAEALKWVIANKSRYNITAINVTDYGGHGTKTTGNSIKASLATLDKMGVYVSAPSGNAGTRASASEWNSSMAIVGSVNKGGGMSGFTQRGAALDFLAPGEKVGLAYYDVGSRKHIYVDTGDGTSWSAPQIAGAAAVLRQINPKLTNAQITSILKSSGTQVYDSSSKRSYSRLNIYNAVRQALGGKAPSAPTPPDPTPDPKAPYGQTASNPITVNGNTTLQVENFDVGNEGQTYHDTDSKNTGGNNYRPGGVDVISINDSGSTRGVGMVKAGEWLKYSINVTNAGSYHADFRVASLNNGGQFHLEVDGKNVSGTLTVPNTRNWNSYTTVGVKGVALTNGKHTLRLVFDRNGGTGYVGNFNQFTLARAAALPTTTPSAPSGSTSSAAKTISTNTVIQVEDFDAGNEGSAYHDTDSKNTGGNNYRAGGVDVISMNDSGSNRAVGMVKAGEWLKYTANVTTAGNYNVEFRVAGLGSGGQFHLEVDGKNVTGTINAPNTKNWNAYGSVLSKAIGLSAGKHTLRLVFDRNGASGYVGNFNQMKFTKVGNTSTSAPAASTPYKTFNLAAGTATTIQAEDFDNGAAGVAYKDQTVANDGKQYRNTQVDIEKSADSGGGYNVGYMKQQEWLNYTVNVTKAGRFNIDTRIASLYNNSAFHVEVDGRNVTGSVKFANTGSFQKWTTIRKSGISLTAGKHVVKLVIDSTGGHKFAGNVNWIKFS
jgi:hypothetical protein